jgi:hypothetical protein
MKPHDAIPTTLTPLDSLEDCQTVVNLNGDAELALLGEAS